MNSVYFITVNNMENNRRNFFKAIGAAGAGIGFLSISGFLASCEKNEENPSVVTGNPTINIADYPALLSAGGFAKVNIDNLNKAIIIRQSETKFSVYDAKCPHQGCELQAPESVGANIKCTLCHLAEFSVQDGSVVKKPLDGSVISGLSQYNYKFDSTANKLEIII